MKKYKGISPLSRLNHVQDLIDLVYDVIEDMVNKGDIEERMNRFIIINRLINNLSQEKILKFPYMPPKRLTMDSYLDDCCALLKDNVFINKS